LLAGKMAALKMFEGLTKPSDAGLPSIKAATIRPYAAAAPFRPNWASARIMGDSPREHLAPLHTALIDPAFGEFLDLFHDTDCGSLEGDAYDRAHSLLALAAGSISPGQFCSTGWKAPEWNTAYIQLLSPFIGDRLLKAEAVPQGGGASFGSTDGTIAVNGMPVLNIELKMPGNPCSAELQNDQYFQRMVADTEGRVFKEFKERALLPACFLVDIYDQHLMVVRGAVYTPPCILSTTLATVNMVAPAHSKGHVALARVLQGLRDGAVRLMRRYEGWSFSALDFLPIAVHVGQLLPRNFSIKPFPMQQAAGSAGGDGSSSSFVLDIGRPLVDGHLAFEATVLAGPAIAGSPSAGKTAVLKIARDAYGVAAHAAAAADGDGQCAPQLLGYERLPGGWHAVLMEKLEKADGWVKYTAEPSQRVAVEAACRARVWDKGFVHGDLRPRNIFVAREAAAAQWRVRIIDWDWAGAAGSKYPLSMNKEVRRAEGAKPGAVITVEHDLAQLLLAD